MRSIFWVLVIGLMFGGLTVFAQNAPATVVYGQADFTSGAANRGGAAGPDTLNYPLGMTMDSEGGLYLADRDNHRVLYFANDGDQIADRVYGQCGSLTAHIANNNCVDGNTGGASANSLAAPTAVALDSQGGLYVIDRDNHRVLYFANDGDTTADRVYGQFGNFATNMTNNDSTVNYGEPSADNIGTYSLGIVVDSTDGFYVSDASNHRVLYFANDGDTTADRVYGQDDDFTTGIRNKGGVSARSLQFPRGLAIDASDGLYVADRDNNRILYFANDGDTTADRVFGQFDDFAQNAESNDGSGGSGAPSAQNLSHPKAVAVDASGGVWITDSLHHRVLYYAPDGDTTADRVLGQGGSFDTMAVNSGGATSVEAFNLPQGILVTADNRLIITDTGNHRMLVIPIN